VSFWLVCLGGALGSGARYLCGIAAVRLLGLGFPWGTLFVNLAGSFLISLVIALSAAAPGAPAMISPSLRLFLTTGVMGGFTTYSAYNYEVLRLYEDGTFGRAGAYLVATLAGCLCFGALGLLGGRALVGR